MRYAALFLLAWLAAVPVAARDTESCNTRRENSIFIDVASLAQATEIAESVARPSPDPDLRWRLWEPISAEVIPGRVLFQALVTFQYPGEQDVAEIVVAMRADPVLAERGMRSASVNGFACFTAPPPQYVTVHEYRNRFTGHYFMTADAAEMEAIARGEAGPGWELTGQSFEAQLPNADCRNWLRVHRFYAPGPNSHFYTLSPQECGRVRRAGTGWQYEYATFWGALPDAQGQCPSWARTPIYRAYNNRWMHNDSNHRFTHRPEVYREMIDRGWIGEGVTMCVSTR